MNHCAICRGAVVFQGGRVARDPDTDEPHECTMPIAFRALLCACGALVNVAPDGRKVDDAGAPHTHLALVAIDDLPPWWLMEEAPIADAPHPAETGKLSANKPRGDAMPPRFTGAFSAEIEIVEGS